MDLRRQPGEARSDWGWRLLMHDLRNPEPQEQHVKTEQKDGAIVNNIYNYAVPTTLKRFNFASVFAIVVMVIFLIALGIFLWKTGAIQHIIDTFRSLI